MAGLDAVRRWLDAEAEVSRVTGEIKTAVESRRETEERMGAPFETFQSFDSQEEKS
jgi:hypothetical protein